MSEKNYRLPGFSAAGTGRVPGGFSLVEIMVALVIGMLGIIVMMQVFAMFEAQKRTTTGGDDAISSGSIALYSLQRDIQHAGWGISAINTIGCTLVDKTTGGAKIKLVQGSTDIPLAPVTINHASIPAGDSNTDTLLIVSGNGNGAVEGDQILSDLRTLSGPIAQPTIYAMRSPASFAINDFVVAAPRDRAASCSLNATKVTAVDHSALNVTLGSAASFAVQPSDRLFHLGADPVIRAYAIRDGNLTVCNWRENDCSSAANAGNAKFWVPIANNMVSLRAQYGRDTTVGDDAGTGAMNGVPDVWDQNIATAAGTGTQKISNNSARNIHGCAIMRIPAVRVVLVARSSQPEKVDTAGEHVTKTLPGAITWPTRMLWMGNDVTAHTLDATAAEVVSIVPPDPNPVWPTWQDFRYKVFQAVIPLRNVTSQGVPEEC